MRELILIGSADVDFFLLLTHILEAEGYETRMAKGVGEITHLVDDHGVKAVLLDCRPDPFPALEACINIKENSRARAIPVIALIGAGAEGQYVDMQRAGAEECFVRPFAPIKLLEYLRKCSSRRVSLPARSGQISYGGVEIDFEHHRVARNGQKIHLGPLEFSILCHLIERPTEICRRDHLIRATWPNMRHVEERTLNVHIGRLRKALNREDEPDLIRTVRGVGYIFEAPGADGSERSTESADDA